MADLYLSTIYFNEGILLNPLLDQYIDDIIDTFADI